MADIAWDDFQKIDIRVGTIVVVEDFPQARRPAYKLQVDFGPMRSECLVTGLHRPDGSVVLATVDKQLPNGAKLA